MNSPLVLCPQCHGSGLIESAPCPQCKNVESSSAGFRLQNKLFFFDFKRVVQWAINQRRAALRVDRALNVVLFFLGVLGFLALGFYVYTQVVQFNTPLPLGLFERGFWDLSHIALRLFFISALIDLYALYRAKRAKETEQYVLAKRYASEAVEAAGKEKSPGKQGARSGKSAEAPLVAINRSYGLSTIQLIEDAYVLAVKNKYTEITPLHLFMVLLGSTESNILLFRLGINKGVLNGKIIRGLQGLYQHQQKDAPQNAGIHFSYQAKEMVLRAYLESYLRGGGSKVEILDLWIALTETEGYSREILYDLDIEAYKIRHVTEWLRVEKKLRHTQSDRKSRSRPAFGAKHGIDRAMTAVETKTLNAFSTDVTMRARQGVLPPSLGHVRELEQIFTILEGGAAGIVLVGAPGIGKESLVDELASRMAAENVPELLQDKRLVALNVAGVLAGGDPAQSSERLYAALAEAAHAGNVVLFIKDIHNLVGIGLKGEGGQTSMGVDQVLTEVLESNRFMVVSTTDDKHYARSIEHSTLKNVLRKIDVKEPDQEETVLMLEARVPYIESRHEVFFTYQSLEEAVVLTNKFIHDTHQPEKAHNILQEVAATVASKRGKRAVVQARDIAAVISEKIDMPLQKIERAESAKLINLEQEIHKKYIDQDYAVGQVSAALRRARAELRDEDRPIANFLFVGPTGVGKTELVKRIAKVYFNSENDMIRLDMSEFQETNSIGRLLGTETTPGLLTEAVRTNPYSVLLLDELEKAHSSILNIFLQVMDDGRATSGDGEVIDFTNLIIVATSNAGTKALQEKLQQGKTIEQIRDQFIKKDLLEFFRPEFLNRFDDVIIFKPLSEQDIEQIAGLILTDIAAKLEEKGIKLEVTREAVHELVQAGFDPLYGARPLRRAIQDHVQNALANFLIAGKIGRRDVVILEAGGKIEIKKAPVL